MNTIKTLILALFLSFSSAASAVEMHALSIEGICTKIGSYSGIFALNYTIGGYGKEHQIKHLNEVVFTQKPIYKFFEPGLLKALDAMEYGKSTLDQAKTEQEKVDISASFGAVVKEACMMENAKGWIQSTPEIRILE